MKDPGEPGIDGATVELLNAAGTTVISTTVTGADGVYEFSGLQPETYSVRFNEPDGYAFTHQNQGSDDALDSDADPTSGQTEAITVGSGEENLTVDAGLVRLATIGDTVWHDMNGNGMKDPGEPGIEGVTVELLNAAGTTVISATVTGADGVYKFSGLLPETYSVRFKEPGGYTFTRQNQGSDDALDSDADPTSGRTEAITVGSGEENLTVDAGLVPEPSGISGIAWEDTDADGIQGAGERVFVGATVNLFDSGGALVGTEVTDEFGAYSFSGLRFGTYSVLFEEPAGYFFSPQDQGDNDAMDSDPDQWGDIQGINVPPGMTSSNWDAGLVPEQTYSEESTSSDSQTSNQESTSSDSNGGSHDWDR